MIALNSIGKQIYWLQQRGEFALRLDYFKSKGNIADIFTRQSPGLEASHSAIYFKKLWDAFGPFQWDLMATFANVNKDARGAPLKFFSRYFDVHSEGVNLFSQQLRSLFMVLRL